MRLKIICVNQVYSLARSPSSWQLARDAWPYCTICRARILWDNPRHQRLHCRCGSYPADLIGTIQPRLEFVEN
jgi:hypothetical protein